MLACAQCVGALSVLCLICCTFVLDSARGILFGRFGHAANWCIHYFQVWWGALHRHSRVVSPLACCSFAAVRACCRAQVCMRLASYVFRFEPFLVPVSIDSACHAGSSLFSTASTCSLSMWSGLYCMVLRAYCHLRGGRPLPGRQPRVCILIAMRRFGWCLVLLNPCDPWGVFVPWEHMGIRVSFCRHVLPQFVPVAGVVAGGSAEPSSIS